MSHRLDEIPRICDEVVVLRDGRNVGELDHEHSVPKEIIPLLVGRRNLKDLFPPRRTPRAETVFSARGVYGTYARGVFGTYARGASGSYAKNINLDLRAGEIVGLTGATGAGQRNFAG